MIIIIFFFLSFFLSFFLLLYYYYFFVFFFFFFFFFLGGGGGEGCARGRDMGRRAVDGRERHGETGSRRTKQSCLHATSPQASLQLADSRRGPVPAKPPVPPEFLPPRLIKAATCPLPSQINLAGGEKNVQGVAHK